MHEPLHPHAIAIIGMAGRFPQAADLDAFWRNIAAGAESLASLSDEDLDAAGVPAALRARPTYVRRGTFLEQAEYFDAAFFGYSPREAQVIDPQQRVFLESAWEAMENAGYAPGSIADSVGVYAGASMNSYVYAQLLRNPALAEAVGGYQIMLGNDKDFLCTRVSYKLGLRGPSVTVQTACSTSLVAVQMACRALQRGECDMALAGGVSLSFPLGAGYLYQEGMILSPDGHCRPFDADARGTRAGAGVGIVVLKRLDEAIAAGDSVRAVIRGIAINNDGAGKAGFTAPSVDGQVEVIATAQALAGVPARSIGYVEAHGTATPLGDPIEIAALTQAFRADTTDTGFCRLGSLKANIGHLDAAAGIAGLIKTVLVLQHRELPPLVNFRRPNPALGLERSPFSASAEGSAWRVDDGTPRRAAVSSFGIGGTNAHAVLEEAPLPAARPSRHAGQLLLLSARSAEALDATGTRLAAHLRAHPEQALADVAFTLQIGRQAFAHRRMVVASEAAEAAAALEAPQRAPVLSGRHEGGTRPVAFLFSGQGSQHAGMGRGLYAAEPVYREVVDRCADLLQALIGADLRRLMHEPGNDAALAETRFTQPALFVGELALATLWRHWGVVPRAMLGHSIGEYVAAHLAGVMSLEDALKLVAARGALMQQMPAGSMAAVQLAADALQPWLADGVEIAAINAPTMCTVSGTTPAVEALLARLKAGGVDAKPLRTSHAFHSAMMEPALAPFLQLLRSVRLSPPSLPYVSNLSGTWITTQQATSPDYYAEHLRRTVRFDAGLRTLAADPALHFVEVGPGTALTSLARLSLGSEAARRVLPSMRRPNDPRDDRLALLDAAGRLWLAGATLDWVALHDEPRGRVPLPSYPFERQRHAVPPADSLPPSTVAVRESGTAPVRRSSNVDDWFYAPTWTRDDSRAQTALEGCWWLVGGDSALAAALQQALAERGAQGVLVGAAGAPHGEGPVPRGAIHLGSLGSAAIDGSAAYDTLVELAAALAARAGGASLRLLHATARAESVLGEPVQRPRDALATGPVLVLPLEWPGLQTRSVDLGDAAVGSTVQALLAELGLPANEPQVAWRNDRRWVRRHERVELPTAGVEALPLRPQGCYLITGGLGGMGLAIARWLASHWQARLLITSRSAVPPREAWDDWLRSHPADDRLSAAIVALREIESAGGAVCVAQADAADEAAMTRALSEGRSRFGELHGVIHAAGVSGQGALALRGTPAAARAVFAPKADGLDVLRRLLGAQSLDLFVLTSSINAVVGAAGACDYASANAVLDAFVDSDAVPTGWRQVVAIDWGAWRDVGMAATLRVPEAMQAHWQAHLAGAIAPAAGVEALARVLASGRRRVVVDTYDLVRSGELIRRPSSPAGTPSKPAPAAPLAPSAPRLQARTTAPAADGEPSAAQRQLLAIWSELLGVEDIGIDDDFFELGGHSLMATRVLSRIGETLGAHLALRDVFDAPTVRALAARVEVAGGAAAPDTALDREELEF